MKAFGKYQLLDEIGKGSAGTAYRAFDPLSTRELVVKILHPTAADAEAKSHFYRELIACSDLLHPNIVKILDIGLVDGTIYVATELLQGVDLQRHFLECRKLPLARKLRLIAQIYDGLALAHRRQITHGGIKAGNIFLTDHGEAKILDFGVAKLPPAQIIGQIPDAASDLFSLAVVLYQLVADVPPFQAGSTSEPKRLRKLDPHVPQELELLVAAALSKDLQQRPQNAEVMAASLCAIAEQLRLEQLQREQPLPQPAIAAPLAALATAAAAGGSGTARPQNIPESPTATSKPAAAASAAPQPARERHTSEVTRIDPAATVPPAPVRTPPVQEIPEQPVPVQVAAVQTAVAPTSVIPKRSPIRRGVVIAAAAALGLFIVAGLLSRQTSNANQRVPVASTLPTAKDVPLPIEPAAVPVQAVVDTPKPEHSAEQILTSQVSALWESGQYAPAMKLVDAILDAEPGNAEAVVWQKKIRAAQEAEAALR